MSSPSSVPGGRGGGDGHDTVDDGYKWKAFAAIGVSFVTVVMSMTMVLVALSAIADDFGVTLRAVGWVVIVESLIISTTLLPLGRLADAIGRRRVHLTGLAGFGTGALLTAVAPTFAVLIVGRMVMAVGNAMTQSVGTAMVVAVFPEAERGKAVGSQTTAVSIGAATGPILGGFMLQVLPWRALFWMLLVPTVVAIVVGARLLDEARLGHGAGAADAPFDLWGALASAVAIAATVITVSNPAAVPWLSPLVLGGVLLAVASAAWFVAVERRHRAPILELELFSVPEFGMGVAARVVGFAVYSAAPLLLPVYLISVRGLSEGAAGSLLLVMSIGMGISAQMSGRLTDRVGGRPLTLVGFVMAGATAAVMSRVDNDTSLTVVAVAVFAWGFSLAVWNVPNNSGILSSVPPSRLGVTGAFTNLTRTLGNVLGQALASAVVVGVMVGEGYDIPLGDIAGDAGAGSAFLSGWQVAFTLVVGLAVAGFALSYLARPRPDPGAASPTPRGPGSRRGRGSTRRRMP